MFPHQIFWGEHIGTSHEQQTSSWKKLRNWQISANLFWEDRSSVSPWIENGQHVVRVLVSRVASLQECFHLVKEMIHQSDIVIVICWTKIGQFGKNKGAELGKQETNLFIHLLSCLAGIGVFLVRCPSGIIAHWCFCSVWHNNCVIEDERSPPSGPRTAQAVILCSLHTCKITVLGWSNVYETIMVVLEV